LVGWLVGLVGWLVGWSVGRSAGRSVGRSLLVRSNADLILGGGLVKHHIYNSNLMRNGADFSVCINTAQEFDGSDAGARPDEAVSWGKIKLTAHPVKLYADASLVFPFIAAMTFAKYVEKNKAH
jgi:deoxyhypusine synthase